MSRHQIGNVVSVAYSLVRLSLKKLTGGGRIKSGFIERISPNVVIDIDSKSKLFLGDRVRIHSGSRLTAAKGGKIELGKNVRINNNCRIACRDYITVGDGVEFGPGVLVYDHDHKFDAQSGVSEKEYHTAPVKIGKKTWIGANTVILRGTEIGENCVVGAGSVLRGKYPDNAVITQPRETKIKQIR